MEAMTLAEAPYYTCPLGLVACQIGDYSVPTCAKSIEECPITSLRMDQSSSPTDCTGVATADYETCLEVTDYTRLIFSK